MTAEFREVMATVCTPVSVVTAMDGARPHGTTVSAFASLSMAPPMVLVSLDRGSALLAVVRQTGSFGVNILSHTQSDTAVQFARKGPDKFEGVSWTNSGGLPRLDGTAGWLACDLVELVDGGDHVLAYGGIVEAVSSSAPPLTYHARTFGTHSVTETAHNVADALTCRSPSTSPWPTSGGLSTLTLEKTMTTVFDTAISNEIVHADLVSRAQTLIPLLQKNAAATEENRRVDQETIDALDQAGLFRLSVPRRHGGFEADITTWIAIEEALGRGDGSTAWAFTILNIGNWFVGLYGEQTQDEIYGTAGGARTCGVFTPSGTSTKVDGGWRVSGKWGYASGCWHANWAMVGFPLTDDNGNAYDQGFGMVPVSDYTIEETWFVAGMSGSGSNTLVLDDIFVPEHRILALGEAAEKGLPTPFTDEHLYQMPFMAPGCLVLAGPQLGLARAALDLVIEKAGRRGIAYSSYEQQTHAPTVQLAVAEAAVQIESARALVYSLCDEVTTTVAAGRTLEIADRTRIRVANAYAIKTAREAIRTLISAHGAASFANVNPLQRIWRDSEVASRHAFALYETAAEVHGKVLLGVEKLPATIL